MKRFLVMMIVLVASTTLWAAGTAEKAGQPKSANLSIILTNYGRFKAQFDQYLGQFEKKELAAKNISVTYNLELPSDANLIKTRLASGDAPDIYALHATFDAPTFEKGGYLPDLSDQPFVPKLLDSVRSIVTMNGKVFGVPMESFTWSYLYNKAIFAKYGLKVPNTLTEMKQVVATLKQNGVTPFELAYKTNYFAGWVAQLSFCAITNKEIPDWWDRVSKGQASLDEARQKGMFDIIDLVNANGNANALEIDVDNGVANFAKGEAAMLVTGPWYSDSILKVDPNFQLGLAPLPVDDTPDHTMVMLAVSTVLTVHPKSPNKAVGIDFLNYILDDQDSSAFFKSLGFNKLAKNQDIPTFPWTADGLAVLNMGRFYRDREIPNSPNDTLGSMAQLYYSKQITQQQFVDEIDKAWKKSVQIGG